MATNTPDLTLFNELYTEIENNPPAIEARKLLVRQCYEAGWLEAAQDALKELRTFDPSALKEESWARNLSKTINKSVPKKVETPAYKPPSTPEELETQKRDLIQGYKNLQLRAKKMLHESRLLSVLAGTTPKGSEMTPRFAAHEPDLNALLNGRVHSILKHQQPGPARGIARQMELSPSTALSIAASDLENVARWLRSHSGMGNIHNDAIREAVVKRSFALSSALPENMKNIPRTAMMHIDHEILGRKYHSAETMYGDLIADIPRDRFLVTDDGYAWDVSELVQAIQSNKGVMRNPLSKCMFTVDDVKAIISHPLGKELVVLQVEQGKLLKGVREETVDELEGLAKVLEKDMSEDQKESREVLEEFMAYLVRLPEGEQLALDGLRVPAVDSHTGIPFDTSIGDAVRDAQGNKLCFHKCADLLLQAVKYLRKSR